MSKEDIGSRRKRGAPSKAKAREMLHDGTVHGHEITDKQRGFFGAVASGKSRRKKRGKSSGY